jgi:hypothetical protein
MVIPFISLAIGLSRHFGSLTIQPGSLVFEPDRAMNRLMTADEATSRIVHTDPAVIMVRARLAPPNLNSSLILRGTTASGAPVTAGAHMPAWTRREAAKALTANGFHVEERVTWFSLGGTGSRWEHPPAGR